MGDWAAISSMATAGGTMVLALATFASTRSANQAARSAERAVQARLRPLLLTTRFQDDVAGRHRPPARRRRPALRRLRRRAAHDHPHRPDLAQRHGVSGTSRHWNLDRSDPR